MTIEAPSSWRGVASSWTSAETWLISASSPAGRLAARAVEAGGSADGRAGDRLSSALSLRVPSLSLRVLSLAARLPSMVAGSGVRSTTEILESENGGAGRGPTKHGRRAIPATLRREETGQPVWVIEIA